MSNHTQASPEQIEHDIAVKRAEMTRTLDSIQRRFSGVHLIESLLGMTRGAARGAGDMATGAAQGARDVGGGLKDTGSAFASNLGRTVRENPVPVALLGLGVGWLALASRRADSHTDGGDEGGSRAVSRIGTDVPARTGRLGQASSEVDVYGNESVAAQSESISAVGSAQPSAGSAAGRSSDARSRARERAQSTAARMSDAGSRAKHGLKSGAESVAERVSDAGSRARESVAAAGTGAREYAGRAGQATREYALATRDLTVDASRTAAHTAREHPLLVAAGLLAAGAAVAAALPRTRREDEWMGEQADSARQAARDAAGEAAREARDAVDTVADATRRAAEREGMTREGARRAATGTVESAGGVVGAAGEAARGEVDKRLSPETRTGPGNNEDRKTDTSG